MFLIALSVRWLTFLNAKGSRWCANLLKHGEDISMILIVVQYTNSAKIIAKAMFVFNGSSCQLTLPMVASVSCTRAVILVVNIHRCSPTGHEKCNLRGLQYKGIGVETTASSAKTVGKMTNKRSLQTNLPQQQVPRNKEGIHK